MKMIAKPDRRETILGCIYLGVDALLLPWLLPVVNALLGWPMDNAGLNFCYFSLNFLAVAGIFHKYLRQSLREARVGRTLWNVALGYLGVQILSQLVSGLVYGLCPEFANLNDGNVFSILRENPVLITLGTIVLVPVAEETLFRGLVFRRMYDRGAFAAYSVSMILFALIHILGYLGHGEPLVLVLSFLQYLPAGYCLCFVYERSGTILTPILLHMLINASAIFSAR